jgi:signal transduction histidine kinase
VNAPARNNDTARIGSVNVLYLRFVELFAFFAIVLFAKILGEFNYRADALLSIFLIAALAQYCAEWIWDGVGSRRNWSPVRTRSAVLWYSSYVDLFAVIALIYFTGTIESPFLFLLTVPLFFVANTSPWKTTIKYFLPVAILGVGALGILELSGAIPHFSCYAYETEVFRNANYLTGSLLVIGAFVSLVLFLSNAFQDRLVVSMERLRRKGAESETKLVEMSRLYDISLGINSAISVETLLKIVAKEATLLIDKPWASIVLFNNKQEITHSVFVGVNQGDEVKLDRKVRRGGLSEWIWTHNTPIVVEDTQIDKRANCSDFLNRFGIRSIIGFPLTTGKQVMGAMYTGDFDPGRFDKDQLRLLTSLSAQLSTAIEKSSLYESLERKIRSLEKQLEALEKTNILKSDFVTHVSHELRTPLTSIKAYVETLCDNVSDKKFTRGPEFLTIISKETDRLIRIVNDILDVSKIEFGQRPLQRSEFNLHELMDDVTSMLSPALDEKCIQIQVDIPEFLPRIDADPDLMKQVFINLISNAVKYSPPETPVTVSAVEEAVDIVVTVEDRGIGIPADEVGNIFDKYFRARSQVGAKLEGVGLGLAIVKNIVEQHGGTIRVESEEGVGSKFIFTIPREHCFNDLIGYIAEVVDAKEQLHEMLELIVKMIAELLSTKVVSLMLLDKTRAELFIKMSYGLDEWVVENARVKVGEGIAGKVAESGVPLFIDNIEENEVYSCPNNPQYETMSLLSVPLFVNDVIVGVINVNNKTSGKPFDQDDLNLLMSFSDRISRALERVRAVEDSRAFLEDTIEAFRRMLETQSKTKLIEEVVGLAVRVSRKLRLSEKEVSVIQYVASVHDIGMTEISDEILNKALHLTSEERKQIREHPQRGAELIRPLEFVEQVSNIILYHHERVDGGGYPMGLVGDEIPIGARILAVIDAFQSMTVGRPYKKRRTVEQAAHELVEFSDRQFDAEVVEAFLQVLKEDGRLVADYARALDAKLKRTVPTTTR